MPLEQYSFEYEVYDSIAELSSNDAALLTKAKEVAETAYAPYSNFFVGAAALLDNQEIVTGTNQENASYPVGICAERSLLATAATLFNNVPIQTMAVAYHNHNGSSNKPISPCGMCRQSLLEYEVRTKTPMRLILGSLDGGVIIVQSAKQLLPFSFTNENLK
ncbi:MAG: cytidine deaminase [Chitinophagaceae bacterium]|jgi:cytidine deaminase|nr:cytidine deaminase [Chitinophagaceae bacterium]